MAPRPGHSFRCSICRRQIKDEWSCNAEPINSGRCCQDCDREVVLPARIRLATMEKPR